MGFIDKLNIIKNVAVESTKKMVEEVKKSNEEATIAKAPVEGAIIRYSVSYIG